MNEEEFDELDNIVVLTDEDGNDVEFEFLDVVQVDNKEYVILLPVEEIEKGEVVIFRIEGDGEEESYIGLEDEEEAEKVFQAFKEKAKDDFNFAD
ncbi:MAG: DUF1292 domain-containing protein [Clostridia bacterium]|nr:DUF1292 domain-containing protein [Clostridia bacterium]